MGMINTAGWVNTVIPASRYDANMTVVSEYSPLPFTREHGSAGLVVRIIELVRLREMRPLFDEMESLTGYRTGQSGCSAEELELLATSAVALQEHITRRISALKKDITECEAGISLINRGDYQGGTVTGREKLLQLNDNKIRTEGNLARAEEHYKYISSLINLLREEVNQQKREGVSLNITLPRVDINIASTLYYRSGSKSAAYIIERLGKLTSAIQSIIKSCSLPVDKYLRKAPDTVLRVSARRFYYSQDGELIRHIMSAEDYLSLMTSQFTDILKRDAVMKSEFNPVP